MIGEFCASGYCSVVSVQQSLNSSWFLLEVFTNNEDEELAQV